MYSKKIKKNKGFTLIEMLAVLAIFGILLAVVIFNYNKFTNDTILTNMAYEMALSVREVQVFGTAVVNPNGQNVDFKTPVGLFFEPGALGNNQYLSFLDDSNTQLFWDLADQQIETFTLQKNIKITEIKTCKQGEATIVANDLSIVFRRPDPEPFINGSELQKAQIELTSPQGTKKYVIINEIGETTVSSQTICP